MKKFLLASAVAISALSITAEARDFNRDNADYRNIKDGPDSPILTKDPNYPVTMAVHGMNLVIENRTNKPVEINGWFFDVAKCDDVDLPKGMFRLPPKGTFTAFVGHCPPGSLKYGNLNVGKYTKKFTLIKW